MNFLIYFGMYNFPALPVWVVAAPLSICYWRRIFKDIRLLKFLTRLHNSPVKLLVKENLSYKFRMRFVKYTSHTQDIFVLSTYCASLPMKREQKFAFANSSSNGWFDMVQRLKIAILIRERTQHKCGSFLVFICCHDIKLLVS